MINRILLTLSLFIGVLGYVTAQTGTIRGNVYDKDTGDPIMFGNLLLEGTTIGTTTDIEGFFTLTDVPIGTYKLVATYVGYDSTSVTITLREGGIAYKKLYMEAGGIELAMVDVSGKREESRKEVRISSVRVTPKQIKALPTIGGEADIAQYLTIIPGVILTGDQGGQIYIRGGSPIQNKIMLDGMRIYNPFHSIGFFSVFETEAIQSVDVLTGGFNAEYAGATSAIVDIKTREGNKKRFGGLISANPFISKFLFEGPISKLKEDDGGSVSFLLTGKYSYLEQTSKELYSYADSAGLPYNFQDIYGKLSFVAPNGSKLNLFGFNFTDKVNFADAALFDWNNVGMGANFRLLPPASSFIIDGTAAFSTYEIGLEETDSEPRTSSITNYNIDFNFTYFHKDNELKYGIEFNGFNTNFSFTNVFGLNFTQKDFTTELGGYVKYKIKSNKLVVEPSLRTIFYASQSKVSVEPRFGLKYNITDAIRFKMGAGIYTQNLVSTVNEEDVVNLFVGFLAGPEERVNEPGTTDPTKDKLQRAIHGVAGFEFDLTKNIELNVEPYYKRFSQLININRNKLSATDPNYSKETGDAYGLDFLLKYESRQLYIWLTYSLGYVNRFDGEQDYPTIFDRRHNVNFLTTFNFGAKKNWELGARWNMGSGFPFTLTQGFFGRQDYFNGLSDDYKTDQPRLEVIYSDIRNGGRLPYYHRLDLSLKNTIRFSKTMSLETIASVTNVYDRKNIFFFDRVRYTRKDQLPILPSLGLIFKF